MTTNEAAGGVPTAQPMPLQDTTKAEGIGRLFRGTLAARLEQGRRELSPEALDLYLMSLLVADDRGRLTQEQIDQCCDLLDRGAVDWTWTDDGMVRVWYRAGQA